ncbi:MAG: ECF-type sigma factor [Vicinamibacterales bacterium]
MGTALAGPVTEWLSRWSDGQGDALDHILPYVYEQLRQVARRQVRAEAPDVISATTVVHETYLRLRQQRRIQACDRAAFLGAAACVMRRVIVDHARRRKRVKRGAGAAVDSIHDVEVAAWLSDVEAEEVLALDDVLGRLRDLDARVASVVEHRVFAGLTLDETATALGVSAKTVQRDWTTARAWLRKELGRDIAA